MFQHKIYKCEQNEREREREEIAYIVLFGFHFAPSLFSQSGSEDEKGERFNMQRIFQALLSLYGKMESVNEIGISLGTPVNLARFYVRDDEAHFDSPSRLKCQ